MEDAVKVVGGVLVDGVLSKLLVEQEDHDVEEVSLSVIGDELAALAELSTTEFGRGLLELADGEALAASIPNGTYAKPAVAGTLASRPAASVGGQRYFATDIDGGTLYESLNGSTWTQVGPGVEVSVYAASAAAAIVKTAEWVASPIGLVRASGTPTLDRAYFTPIWIPVAGTLKGLAVETIAVTALATARVGWHSDNNQAPGQILADVAIDCSTGTPTGIKTSTGLAVPVTPGLYWFVVTLQGATTSMRCYSAALAVLPSTTPNGGAAPMALYKAGVTGAYSSNPVLDGATAAATAPLVFAQIDPS